MNNESFKEFRLKSGKNIINYIKHFSLTEKTIFSFLIIIAGITAMIMAIKVSEAFMISIPSKGGEINEGMIGLPHMINPVLAVTDVDRDISALIYSGLMKYSGGKLVPDLAKSYKISEDGLIYTFTLKPDIKFHDGSQLTTDDVAFTVQKIQNIALKSPRRADWNNITINIISPKEIQFVLKQPYSPFLTNTTLGIIPKHIWNNVNDDQFVFSEYNTKPIGSGPYQIKSVIKNSEGIPLEYKLISSKKYYNNKAYLDTINFLFFADEEKAIQALQKGSIDSIASISSTQTKEINLDSYKIISTPLPRIFGIFFNQNNNQALAEKTVRQALELSIDRQQIIDLGLDGYGSPIYGPLPYEKTNSSSTKRQNANIPLAQSILEKSGWTKNPTTGIYEKKGPKNTLMVLSFVLITADTTDLKKTAQIINDSWTKLGAKVDLRIYDPSALYQSVIRPRDYDALLFGQHIGKERDLYAFWHSSQRNPPGLNVAMYTNTKVDSILEFIRTSSDEKQKQLKYEEFEKIIKNDIPAIFLYSPNFIYILPKKLKNTASQEMIIDNITNPFDRWNSVTDWYINTEKVWSIFKK